jgi:transposase-like protein
MQKYTKAMFDKRFPDDNACLEFLKNARWPNGITCTKCQDITKHYRIRAKKAYGCEFCGTLVSPTADTIFHKSPTPLRDWFYAIFLMANTRMGISAMHLKRELGVTYKTAWRMFTQIRKLTANDAGNLFGQIEVDETYIGGKRPGKRGRGAAGKTIAVGLVERKGNAVVIVTNDVKARTLLPIIREHIPTAEGTTIFTDEMSSYHRLSHLGFNHETVNHAAKEYVNGTAHTNNVEGLWSIVKNGITGANRHVSPQHLQSYLDAYVFRYNHRNGDAPIFGLMMNQVSQRLS